MLQGRCRVGPGLMESQSEASPSTPKQFFGDIPVLDLDVGISTDRFFDPGRLEECQVVVDHAELPSEADIEKLWLNLDRKVDIVFTLGNRSLETNF